MVEYLAEEASSFFKKNFWVLLFLDAIVLVPPSENHPFQLVEAIAVQLGKLFNLPVATDCLIKLKETPPLKNYDDPLERKDLLKGAFKVKDRRFKGKVLLVFDDTYRSGETLAEVTQVLHKEGKIRKVYVLTLTKTRVKR